MDEELIDEDEDLFMFGKFHTQFCNSTNIENEEGEDMAHLLASHGLFSIPEAIETKSVDNLSLPRNQSNSFQCLQVARNYVIQKI